MPRVTSVAKAQKEQGSCGKCGTKIETGQPYRWWKFRYGGRRVRCMKPNCSPRSSDLTGSDKLSRCYAAGESISDAIDEFRKNKDIDDLRSTLEDAANEIREVGEEYRESASNVENGMNGNRMPICDELEEKADNLDSKADEIEGVAGDLEEFSEEGNGPEDMDDNKIIEKIKEDDSEFDPAKLSDKEKAEKIEEKRTELKEEFDQAQEEWVEEQAAKAEDHTEISPEG
jgi:hypothetical protein